MLMRGRIYEIFDTEGSGGKWEFRCVACRFCV